MLLPRFCCVLLACVTACAAPGKPRPNVIFILADDLGWMDLGCYGSALYETPHLDRLARQGVRFSAAYAACNVCSPTRASILTGKYPARLNLTDWLPGRPDRPDQKLNRPNLRQELPLEEVTVAEALKSGGYRTGFIGKWHLGTEQFYPEKQGFDLNLGGCNKGHPPSYFSPYNIPTLPDGPAGEYLTDRLTDESLRFIVTASEQPFFLYLAHYAVHTPLQAKPELVTKYQTKLASMKRVEPEFKEDLGRRVRQVQTHAVYAAMMESLDQSVGRIMAKLQELRIDTNTVIFFTSDNGGLSTAEGTPTSNVPLRTGKGWNYEGGIRVPLIVSWPGVAAAGLVCGDPVISTDYYPTLLEIAGLPARPEQHRDGLSLVGLLKGGCRPARPLFWHYPHYSNQGGPPSGALRLGPWKLIEFYEDMRTELYNLNDDLSEQRDLAKVFPDKARELTSTLHQIRAETGAKMPVPNPSYDPDYAPGKKRAK